jgi:hypothetical protein
MIPLSETTSMPTTRRLVTYLVLVFLFSSCFYFLIIRAHQISAGEGLYVLGIMWCPALAAFATLRLCGGRIAELGWRWPARRYALMSWGIPLAYAFVAYAIVWLTGLGGFPNHDFVAGITSAMGPRFSPAVATALYVRASRDFRACPQPFQRARRRNRLARLPRS